MTAAGADFPGSAILAQCALYAICYFLFATFGGLVINNNNYQTGLSGYSNVILLTVLSEQKNIISSATAVITYINFAIAFLFILMVIILVKNL